MFAADIEANKEKLTEEIKGKKVCVIGGAGSIGSSFIKAVLRFEPKSVVVVDLNENGLAELVRDARSTKGLYVPDEFRCYTLNFADPIFARIFREEKGFDIVATSLPTSTCAARRTATVCRRSSRTMTSRPSV
jgi:threonine dehydrogenase-like Zn-dependent dehydrogenase